MCEVVPKCFWDMYCYLEVWGPNFLSMDLEDCLISWGIIFDARNVILWILTDKSQWIGSIKNKVDTTHERGSIELDKWTIILIGYWRFWDDKRVYFERLLQFEL